jgi:hypothetical protein
VVASQLSEGDRFILNTVEVPQVNELGKMFMVAELVSRGATTRQDVAKKLGVAEKDVGHYLAAAQALRLVRIDPGTTPPRYMLGYLGDVYLAANRKARVGIMIRGTLAAPHVVYVAERLGLRAPLSTPTPRELKDVVLVERELATLGVLSGATPRRRASTLVAWMKTVDKLARQS